MSSSSNVPSAGSKRAYRQWVMLGRAELLWQGRWLWFFELALRMSKENLRIETKWRTPSNLRVAVIGGGPGGYAAAFLAADLGMKVTLIDPEVNPGGVCLYRGCIPSKALLHVAKLLEEAEQAKNWGIEFGEPKIDLNKLRGWKESVVKKLTGGLGQLSKQRSVQFVQGKAAFVNSTTLKVTKTAAGGEENLTFDRIIIATGSRPTVVPSLKLDSPRLMDSTSALDLPDVPKTLLVIGGGYIGLELGSVYATLGTKVTCVEMMPGLLPGADRDLVLPLHKRLEKLFAAILLNTTVKSLKDEKTGIRVTLEGPNVKEKEQVFDRVLMSVGRRPNSEIPGLDKTKVKVNQKGFIEINEQRQTADPTIYAIGDVAGEPMLAHKAMHEGRTAVEAIAGHKVAFEPNAIPAVVFTDPEIAWAGLTETQAKEQGREITIAKFPVGRFGARRHARPARRSHQAAHRSEDGARARCRHRGRGRGRTDRRRRAGHRNVRAGGRCGHDDPSAPNAIGDDDGIGGSILRTGHRHLSSEEVARDESFGGATGVSPVRMDLAVAVSILSREHRGRAGTPGSPLTGISMKKLALLVLVVSFSLHGLMAQSVNSLLKAGEQTPTPASADALGRETPSGTVLGFLQAAQAGNYKTAADYLQMSAVRRQSQGADLAEKLKVLMDRAFVGSLRRLSTRPEGNPEYGTSDQQTIGIFSYGDADVPVVLVRVGDPNSGKIWLFSSETLSKVPELYDNVQAHRVEKKLPQSLVRNVFLGMPLWQWLALLAAIPFALAIGWVVVLLLAIPRRLWLKFRNRPNLHSYSRMSTPLLVSFSALAHRMIAGYLGLPLLPRLYYYRIIGVLISIGFFWFLLRATSLTMQRLRTHAISAGRIGTGTLMVLGERLLTALVVIVAVLATLGILGFNLTTVLAGLGIGGIAIAFAAQKTLENLFGGVSVLADEVIRVGDYCRFGDRTGTVEDISLRSTRVRTDARTELSIPNGALATMNIENFTRRDKILFNPALAIRYETSADQLRYLLAEVRRMLYEHPKVESDSAQHPLRQFRHQRLAP